MSDLAELTVVVRGAGERSEAACREAILDQGLPPENLVLLQVTPFLEALRQGFRHGIETGRPWLLCVDADVVLRSTALSTLMAHARQTPEAVFKVQSLLLDKLTLSIRMVGAHLYRASHLPAMLECLPEDRTTFRPETEVLLRMRRRGYRTSLVPGIVGLHDFGQSNRDIFRKCYAHAQKHLHLLPQVVPLARKRADADPDFEIALHGFAEGLKDRGWVPTDVRYRPFHERFEALGLSEKDGEAEFPPDAVEAMLTEWTASEDVWVRGLPVTPAELMKMDGTRPMDRLDRVRALLRQKRRDLGTARLAFFLLGAGLERSGRRIKTALKAG